MAPKLLSSTNFKSLFNSVDTFLFDCDGIVSVSFVRFFSIRDPLDGDP